MEAMNSKSAKSSASSTSPCDAKAVPHYLRPSTGSCHDACKYGGHHTFEEKEAPKAQPKPRKQPPAVVDEPKRRLVKVRSLSRRRIGDFGKAAEKARPPVAEAVEWKDIVAYDAVPLPAKVSSAKPDKSSSAVANSGDGKKRDVMKGKMPIARVTEPESGVKKQTESLNKGKMPIARITEPESGVKKQTESLNKKFVKSVRSKLTGKASTDPQAVKGARVTSATDKNIVGKSRNSVKPPKGKKVATLSVENKVAGQETVQRDAATDAKEEETVCPLDQEEYAAAAESSRPIPVHRRVKSMSMSSRSVRFPFVRQASKNSATFKLRSKSTKAPILPSEEEKPSRLGFRKGRAAGEEPSSGIQLRIRSLRRRGFGGSGSASSGFVVPEVRLRHQKTLEKKKSRKLYNNMIEETASKLVKSRKSRVKSLVGAFETLISKIGK